jgi:hypothetical protein
MENEKQFEKTCFKKKIGICFLKFFFVKTFFQVGMFCFWPFFGQLKAPNASKKQ